MICTIAVRTLKIGLVLFLLLGWYIVSLCGKSRGTDHCCTSRLTYAELLRPDQWSFESYQKIGCGTVTVETEVKTWLFVRITQEKSTTMLFWHEHEPLAPATAQGPGG